jgi:cytoskeletal protein RodZ
MDLVAVTLIISILLSHANALNIKRAKIEKIGRETVSLVSENSSAASDQPSDSTLALTPSETSTNSPPIQSTTVFSIEDLSEITHLSQLPEPYYTTIQNFLNSQFYDYFLTFTHLLLFNLTPKDSETSLYYP